MAIIPIITTAKAAIDTAKTLTNAIQEFGKVELKLKAVELTQQITELALENAELHRMVNEIRAEVAALKIRLQTRDELIWRHNLYFRKVGDKEDGPFCTRCFDVDGILVRFVTHPGCNFCPHCDILKRK